MYVTMYKQKEDENFVWYKFEKSICIGKYIDEKGRKLNKFEKKYGLFKFNKKIKNPKTNAIEIIKNKTDKHFWNDRRTLMMCWVKMIQCKKEGSFHNTVTFASG